MCDDRSIFSAKNGSYKLSLLAILEKKGTFGTQWQSLINSPLRLKKLTSLEDVLARNTNRTKYKKYPTVLALFCTLMYVLGLPKYIQTHFPITRSTTLNKYTCSNKQPKSRKQIIADEKKRKFPQIEFPRKVDNDGHTCY